MPRSVRIRRSKKADRNDKDKEKRRKAKVVKSDALMHREFMHAFYSPVKHSSKHCSSPMADPRVASVAFIPTSESSRRAIVGVQSACDRGWNEAVCSKGESSAFIQQGFCGSERVFGGPEEWRRRLGGWRERVEGDDKENGMHA